MRAVLVLLVVAACGRFDFELTASVDAAPGAIDAQTDARTGPNRAFVSQSTATGNLGGLAGADAICQASADAAHLGGTFGALLWDTTTKPSMRLAGSRGWVDMIGRPIADEPTDFDVDATLYPMLYDETGAIVEGVAWTGYNGGVGACTDWTQATVGTFVPSAGTRTTLFWFIPENAECAQPAHLNCVERGQSVAVAPTPVGGRLAFVSNTAFAPGGGLAAADAICNGDAAAAGLSGVYHAWLASSGGRPATRFGLGAPWTRVDGVALGATADVVLSSDDTIDLDAFVSETATGATWNGLPVWVGTTAEHCTDWTSNTGTGTIGDPGSTQRAELEDFESYDCAFPENLICLQL